ncbi:hypothetical protein TNCV_4680011 [Trichonephila clavipes]|nr:hypothetical protein TNCV_4680011 [Trichonephila clavipes]
MKVARALDRFDFLTIDGDTTYLHLHNLDLELEGDILQPPTFVVSAATAHKAFAPTDLTSTSTQRRFGNAQLARTMENSDRWIIFNSLPRSFHVVFSANISIAPLPGRSAAEPSSSKRPTRLRVMKAVGGDFELKSCRYLHCVITIDH